MQKYIQQIKSVLARLLGAYFCIFAPPLFVALLQLPHHLDRADWLTEFLYPTTPWGWMDHLARGQTLFAEVFTAPESYRYVLILIVYGLLVCFLASLMLWFKKPWRWWSAATLIGTSFMMHWLHWGGMGLGLMAIPIAVPLTYLLCFLGARLLHMEQPTHAEPAQRL